MLRLLSLYLIAVLALLAPFRVVAQPAADLFSVTGVHVDATAESATAARDRALQNGRPAAWQRLYRRLAPQTAWDKQPQLDDKGLQRIIRSFEVANERRSTTRYLADVTYHFNAAEVRRLMRDASAPLAETRAKPALVIPVTVGKGFEANSDWTRAWADPTASEGIVPLLVPGGDSQDLAVLMRADVASLEWPSFRAMADRYDANEVVVAQLSANGAIAVRYITAAGIETQSIGIAPGAFGAATDAVARKLGDAWKLRSAVDYGRTSTLIATASLASLQDWSAVRQRLSQIRAVADVQVLGMSVSEAQMQITFYGRPDQLVDAMAQQNLDLRADGSAYALRVGAVSAAAP